MVAYILRRLLFLPVVIFIASVLIFALLAVLPPETRAVAFTGEDPHALGAGKLEAVIQKYHLRDNPIIQYWNWITSIFRGNLGWSSSSKQPVLQALVRFIPSTLELVLATVLPLILLGIWMGVTSAVNHNRPIDHITRFMSITGYSLPTFVAGLVLLMVFYGIWHMFGVGQFSNPYLLITQNPELFRKFTGINTLDAILNGRWDIFWDALQHLILPAITLSYVSWALIVRITRSSMLNSLREDYVTTARAKGLAENVVVHKHARRNALIPVITISGYLIAGLLSGVAITETIFNFKGVGYFFVQAAGGFDIPAVLGFTLFSGLLWVFANLIVDIMYSYIDPRVRLD
ncbi:ABC transporter permease [Candidatus Acetothermia bacterium]|nr:ABC transporter permease [Candidatus Acetothermia bacterium]